ncbi:MAG: hypothetical protein ACYDHC_13260 [Desulfuromonadaceae bacterium]
MKTNQMMVMGLAALCAVALAGEASARGGNGGGSGVGVGAGGGSGMKVQTQTHTRTQTRASTGMATTRPADSQRHDGTFLTTGTTANGSTVRPGNGKGLQDGSGMTVPTTAPTTVTPE